MESKEKIFANGIMYKPPTEKAPDFVKGSISVKVDEFTAFLAEHNNGGWVNLDIKLSKNEKYYIELNVWKPQS